MSVEYKTFILDCQEFRKKLGERSFWELPVEKRDDWFAGLGCSFVMLDTDAVSNEKAATIFNGIATEYAMRNAHVLVQGLPKQKLGI